MLWLICPCGGRGGGAGGWRWRPRILRHRRALMQKVPMRPGGRVQQPCGWRVMQETLRLSVLLAVQRPVHSDPIPSVHACQMLTDILWMAVLLIMLICFLSKLCVKIRTSETHSDSHRQYGIHYGKNNKKYENDNTETKYWNQTLSEV